MFNDDAASSCLWWVAAQEQAKVRHQNEVLFLRNYLGGRVTHNVMAGRAWNYIVKRRKLKYIFHDYAKMEMHGLIKKSFYEGIQHMGPRFALLSKQREKDSFWHTSENEIYYKRSEMERVNKSWCWVLSDEAFSNRVRSLKDMLAQLKFEKCFWRLFLLCANKSNVVDGILRTKKSKTCFPNTN